LKVVTKNLADPVKSKDEKYRQLKLDNEKIQTKLMPCQPYALGYLQNGLGFVLDENTKTLSLPSYFHVNLVHMQGALEQVTQALNGLSPAPPSASKTNTPTYERQSSSTVSSYSATSSTTTNGTEKLSEKQKARRLLEEKQKAEQAEARRLRKATSDLIKQDKYVREHDENWTSGPSAAVNKSGTAISTFRDRHGEQ